MYVKGHGLDWKGRESCQLNCALSSAASQDILRNPLIRSNIWHINEYAYIYEFVSYGLPKMSLDIVSMGMGTYVLFGP